MGDSAEEGYESTYASVFRFIRKRAATLHDAEDITQEVFLRAAEHLGRRAGDTAPPAAWLFHVARNHLIDEARKRTRHPADVPLESALDFLEHHDSEYGSRVARILRRTYRRLPKTQQQVVTMRLLEGRPFAEIAAILEIDEAACKMRLARALETMRDDFTREGLTP